MPVNTPALGPGGGPNAPFGLGGVINEGGQTAFGDLVLGYGGGASLDTVSAQSLVGPQMSSMSFKGVNYAIPASDSVLTTVVWTQVRPGDVIFGGPVLTALASAASSAAIWKSHCTIAGRFELGFLNSSITAITLSVQTWGFVRIGLF